MIEPEHIKGVTLILAGGVAKVASIIASTGAPDEVVSMWIERGGTGLAVVLLIIGLRMTNKRLRERDDRLDSMHDKELASHEKSTEARMQLAESIKALSTAVDSNNKKIDDVAMSTRAIQTKLDNWE